MVEIIQKYYDPFVDISLAITGIILITGIISGYREIKKEIGEIITTDATEERANSNIAGKAKDVA